MKADVLPLRQSAEHPNEALLALCKAAGDDLRLSILSVLRQDAFSVQELCDIFAMRQSAMSHHLKLLAGAGLLVTRREGNCIYYRRSTPASEDGPAAVLQTALLDAANHYQASAGVSEQLQAVYRRRSEHSRDFFSRHAGELQRQQEQIAAYEVYGPATADLLRDTLGKGQRVLEVGPGEGAFLLELAPLFEQVIGLDTSPALLDIARDSITRAGAENVSLLEGSVFEAALEPASLDCMVVNMVLHHLPSPAEIFSVAGQLLKTDGILSVTELCTHDQNWVRDSCGDLWLGFDPDDLNAWAQAAGLEPSADVYLAQRNGFRIQVRQFRQTHTHGSSITETLHV